jgi:hypothetical protein
MMRLTYPRHKVVAALGRSDADIAAAALGEAGFDRDRIEIVTADEIEGLADPIGGSGLRRLLVRLLLSLGDDLDELEAARRELVSGHALVQIRVHGRDEQVRAHAILRQHGGHGTHYFGRWTITPLVAGEATAGGGVGPHATDPIGPLPGSVATRKEFP